MKKLLPFLLLACCFFSQQELTAQERYQDEIFSEVTVTSDVVYGTNISILPALTGGDPGPEEMRMDVYEPAGDDLTERPVVIITHRGDFLPAVVNQQPYGFKGDFAVVELLSLIHISEPTRPY